MSTTAASAVLLVLLVLATLWLADGGSPMGYRQREVDRAMRRQSKQETCGRPAIGKRTKE